MKNKEYGHNVLNLCMLHGLLAGYLSGVAVHSQLNVLIQGNLQ